jgi:glyoxylase-like metal-dependent hydrolase (beta-lactamase superfamily II)
MNHILSGKKSSLITSLLVSALFVLSPITNAAAPMAKTPTPGFFRMMLGDFEITVVSDGTVDLPVDKLLAQPEEKTHKMLSKSHLKAPLETSVNTFLINTGSKLVLVDTGAGGLFGPTLGNLIRNLKAAGYSPDQIDHVLITHMHGDHVGGLMATGARTFPNATIHADQQDADFWLSKTEMDKAPDDKKGAFQGAMVSLTPYVDAKKFVTFNGDTPLVPGIKSIATYGHTPGHSIYEVESQGKKLWLIGNLIHVAAVQMDHPKVTIAFDSDQKQAAQARAKIFTEAAKQGILIGAAHLQFPGMGYLEKDGKAYKWIPVNYTQMR